MILTFSALAILTAITVVLAATSLLDTGYIRNGGYNVGTRVEYSTTGIVWEYTGTNDSTLYHIIRSYAPPDFQRTETIYSTSVVGLFSDIYNESIYSIDGIYVVENSKVIAVGITSVNYYTVTLVYNTDFSLKLGEAPGKYIAYHDPYILLLNGTVANKKLFLYDTGTNTLYSISTVNLSPSDAVDFYLDQATGNLYVISSEGIGNFSLNSGVYVENSYLPLGSAYEGTCLFRVFKKPTGEIAVIQGYGMSLNLTTIYDIASGNVETKQFNFDLGDGQYYLFDSFYGCVNFINFTRSYMAFDTTSGSFLAAPINNEGENISYAGIFVYNSSIDTFSIYRIVNFTEVLGSPADYYGYSFAYDSANDIFYFSTVQQLSTDIYYYLLNSTPSVAPTGGGGVSGGLSTYSPMEIFKIFASIDRDYRVLRYVTNETHGWIVSDAYEIVSGNINTSSEGLAVFKTYFNGTNVEVYDTYFEELSLGRPLYVLPLLIGDKIVIGGGGLTVSESTPNDTALLMFYNVTSDSLKTFLYENYLPIVYVGFINSSTNGLPIFLVEANGTIVYVSGSSELRNAPTLSRSGLKIDIDSWSSNATRGLVGGVYSVEENSTYIYAIVKDPSTGNATLKIYNFADGGLQDLTPTGNKLIFSAQDTGRIGIADVAYYLIPQEKSGINIVYIACLIIDASNGTMYNIVYTNETGSWTLTIKDKIPTYELMLWKYGYVAGEPSVAGGNYNATANTFYGVIYPIDTYNFTIDTGSPLTYLSISGENAWVKDFYEFGETILVGVSDVWGSPGGVAVSGTTTGTAQPIPEPWMLSLALLITTIASLLIIRRRKS